MSALRLIAIRRRRLLVLLAALSTIATGAVTGLRPASASDDVIVSTSSVKGADGTTYTVTNHLISDSATAKSGKHEWLLVWAGDAGDPATAHSGNNPIHATQASGTSTDPDFLAVIDATRGSPTYGKVVNTAAIGPLLQNEPHHMQYVWHKGNKIYAGGMFSDTTYVFDVARLPQLKLSGINAATDTPCGSVPDAYWTLKDGTAYGTYMGGPNVSGPCQYTHGETRTGNGFAGSPGEVVRVGPDGRTLDEAPAATEGAEDPALCHSIPALPTPTCANPHGIQVREDLNRMITSDFAEVRNLLGPPPSDPYVTRDTVRIFDIADRNNPKLLSVSHLPDGPRQEKTPTWEEPRVVMETTVTNQPRHHGAFASTMGGGVIYYTSDITDPHPTWREVFDDTTAFNSLDPSTKTDVGMDGGAWLQTSPTDQFLFHAVMQRGSGSSGGLATGMIYVLDIRKLLAADRNVRCNIDTLTESGKGGAEADCPALVSTLPIEDPTSGGPHWGALDNFRKGLDGYYHETTQPSRLAVSNYFVAGTNFDGDHRVCMVNVDPSGHLSLDQSFRDENTHAPCVTFDRAAWPHGATGDARPHGVLFVVSDADVR